MRSGSSAGRARFGPAPMEPSPTGEEYPLPEYVRTVDLQGKLVGYVESDLLEGIVGPRWPDVRPRIMRIYNRHGDAVGLFADTSDDETGGVVSEERARELEAKGWVRVEGTPPPRRTPADRPGRTPD